MDKISQPVHLSMEYREDASVLLASTHKHLTDQGLTPGLQRDTYSVPSRHIVGAIGRTGMRLSTRRERCPITDSLVPMGAVVDVYNDVFQAATTYEYDYSTYSDIWMHRLSALDAHKAQPLTTANAAGLLAARLKDTRDLKNTIDSPHPSSTSLVNDLLEYADKRASDHAQVSRYTIPLPTKSTRQDHRNDANAIFTVESTNKKTRKLSLDIATFHEFDEKHGLLRSISISDRINPRGGSHGINSSLSLRGYGIDSRYMQKLLRKESGDVWQLYEYIKVGAAALKSAMRLPDEPNLERP